MNAHSALTGAQARLLQRHQRGLGRLAGVLSAKAGRDPTEIMFVLAHRDSNVGTLAREQLGDRVVGGSEAVVVPGLATELDTWLARLALAGPVYDCTSGLVGIAVVVIDERNEMAVCRLSAVSDSGLTARGF
jgi:hypothetical protein